MREGRGRRGTQQRGLVLLALAVLLAALTGAGASAAPLLKKKHLSLTNVIIHSPATGTSGEVWVAQDQGFFKQAGLNVTLDNSVTTSANGVALLVSGSVQFLGSETSAELPAVQAGGSIRAIYMIYLDEPQEIAINQGPATKFNIPAVGNTAAGALAQLLALKGSHLNIDVANISSSSYLWLVTIAEQHGLTIGPNGDFNINTVGSTTALQAALLSGKADGIVNVPPVTVAPNTIDIQLWKIPPATTAAGSYLMTSTSMIQQHPDTVQAITNAMTQAWHYIHSHPAQAGKDIARGLAASAGITSPEENDYMVADAVPFYQNPFPTKASYTSEVKLINGAQSPPLTVPYATAVDSRFVAASLKQYGS